MMITDTIRVEISREIIMYSINHLSITFIATNDINNIDMAYEGYGHKMLNAVSKYKVCKC